MTVDTWVAIAAFVVPTSFYLIEKFSKRSSEDAQVKSRLEHVERDMAVFRNEIRDDRAEIRDDIVKLFTLIDSISRSVTRLVTIEEERHRRAGGG